MSRIKHGLLVIAVLLGADAGAGAAQAAPAPSPLQPGARVRLEWTAEGAGPRRGSVGSAAPDSAGFLLRPANRDAPRRVEFAALEKLEVRTYRNSRTAEGMLIGLVAGIAAAYAFTPHENYDLDPRPFVAIPVGLVGGAIGGVIGWATADETWTAIPIR